MVRILNSPNYSFDHKAYVDLAGLSTDTKPTDGIMTGSVFTEVDTGKVFFFDESAAAGSEWVEQFGLQQS